MREWRKNNPDKVKAYKDKEKELRDRGKFAYLVKQAHLENEVCSFCFWQAETLDHVVPTSKGGKTDMENLVPICNKCNSEKNDKDLIIFLLEKAKEQEIISQMQISK